ncbi:hypothetical protein [Dyadobacter psychrotolerans]|uniref:DUF4199 domain-containing protein n=1 Tax=Dyadobacter psychrotolerans TaxID=2541721 RepID=A0A4V2Z351_9BACT|nr:hypothetical protein [Dyadobacter psychrotolerans]TDE11348.1 hypothetical protein E0F88_25900 [Dyadobacter psychrotolerans]
MNYFLNLRFRIIIFLLCLVNCSYGQSEQSLDSISPFEVQTKFPVIKSSFGKYLVNHRIVSTQFVMDVLAQKDSANFTKFNNGHRLLKTGGTIAIVGAGVTLVGAVVTMIEIFDDLLSFEGQTRYTGVAIVGVGSGISLSGLAVLVLGKHKKNQAVKFYNSTIATPNPKYSIYLKPSANKVTVGLRF